MTGPSRYHRSVIDWRVRLYAQPEHLPRWDRPRKRCRNCRRAFSFFCVDGRFCSPECAGWPEYRWHAVYAMQEWVDDALSCGCRGSSGQKIGHHSEDEARRAAEGTSRREGVPMYVYPCPRRSGKFHVTKRAPST
jgi:hypothetical protein